LNTPIAVFTLVVLHTLGVVLRAVAEQAIDKTGQQVGHRGDGYRSVHSGPKAAILGAQVAFAAVQALRGEAQGGGGTVQHFLGAAPDDFSSCDSMVGTPPQPGGEVVLVRPARHIDSHFGDDHLSRLHLDAIDARQVHASDAIEFLPQVSLRNVLAPGQAWHLGQGLGSHVGLGLQRFQVRLDASVAGRDAFQVREIQIMHLRQHEQPIFPPMSFQALSDLFPAGLDARVGQSGQALRARAANCHQLMGRLHTGTTLGNGHEGTNLASVIAAEPRPPNLPTPRTQAPNSS